MNDTPGVEAPSTEAINLMEELGGHFAHNIARAYRYADSGNKERLLKAFPVLFGMYVEMHESQRQVQEAHEKLRSSRILLTDELKAVQDYCRDNVVNYIKKENP